MFCVDYLCDSCKHQRENIDGWKIACDAFPDGTPFEHYQHKKDDGKECNNGIGYEPREETK